MRKQDARPGSAVPGGGRRLACCPGVENSYTSCRRSLHGAVVDLHALRVTYATLLGRAGVSLVQAQKLMRHSDPKLTANIYTRLQMDDAREAVAKIDAL
jgi:integrase